MVFIWRGWGPIALIFLFPPLLLVTFLIGFNPIVALGAAGASLFFGGMFCGFLGIKLNRGSGYHMVYYIPLEIIGLLYILLSMMPLGLLALGVVVAGVKWISQVIAS